MARISENPVLCAFDGIVRKREPGEPQRIFMLSMSGVDFAGRKHDVDDIKTYIKNWDQVTSGPWRSVMPGADGGGTAHDPMCLCVIGWFETGVQVLQWRACYLWWTRYDATGPCPARAGYCLVEGRLEAHGKTAV